MVGVSAGGLGFLQTRLCRDPDVRAAAKACYPVAHQRTSDLGRQDLDDLRACGVEWHQHAISCVQVWMLPIVAADFVLGRRNAREPLIEVRVHPEILPDVLAQMTFFDAG